MMKVMMININCDELHVATQFQLSAKVQGFGTSKNVRQRLKLRQLPNIRPPDDARNACF